MSFEYNEDLLQFIWEHQLYDSKNLKTADGESIAVLKQGYLNSNSGPDFENAEIKIGNTKHYGSIEIHINSKEWKQHKHHIDTAYNNVILHVCFSLSSEEKREDGTSIPSLEIGPRINTDALAKYDNLMSTKPFIPCQNQIESVSSFDMENWKDRMVIERLEDRCSLYKSFLQESNGNWNQAFYIAIVRAFGMPINTLVFEDIAKQLPYDLVQKHHQSLFQLEALFFGIAGLLYEDLKDNYYIGLQNEFSFLKTKYGLTTTSVKLKFGRMRPMNLPHVKLAQLAAFFHHVPQFINTVLDLPDSKKVKQLLKFNLSDFWNTHYSFAKPSGNRSKGISSAFVDHLFLNSIVPFVFYYEKEKTDVSQERALDYLASIASEKNSIISKWKATGVNSKNASSSQALLHLYKTYCKPQRCLQCNIGKKLLLKV